MYINRLAHLLTSDIIRHSPLRQALVDATTHWRVETTTAASSRIVGDFLFLDTWLGGGDAEAYIGSPSLWKSLEPNVALSERVGDGSLASLDEGGPW